MPNSLATAVTDEISAWMGRRRLSSAQVAVLLGVSGPWMWRRMRGETSWSLDDIERIAAVLNVPASRLLPPVEVA